jgi:Zn-dependent protease
MIPFIYIIGSAASILIGVVAHEIGHLVCGKFTGHKLVSFRLFFLVWFKKDGKWVVARAPGSPVSGQCLMEPPEDESHFRFGLLLAGGSLVNLLLAASGAFLLLTRNWGTEARLALTVFALVNGVLAATNLIPLGKGIPNDGTTLKEALQTPAARRAFHSDLRIFAEMARGKRLGEIDETQFLPSPEPTMGNLHTAVHYMMWTGWLSDRGELDRWGQALREIDISLLPPPMAAAVQGDQLYYHLVYGEDLVSARVLYQRQNVQRLLRSKQPGVFRMKAACEFFIEGHQERSWELIRAARKSLSALGSSGMMRTEAAELDQLESILRAKLSPPRTA